jgi:hypothetical protein
MEMLLTIAVLTALLILGTRAIRFARRGPSARDFGVVTPGSSMERLKDWFRPRWTRPAMTWDPDAPRKRRKKKRGEGSWWWLILLFLIGYLTGRG